MAFTTLKGRTHTSLAEINITPFVDVVLVLLIIFMLTAPILESGIEVDLPKTHTVKAISDEKVVVTIDKRQTIYVGNDPVNIHRLGSYVLDHLKGAGETPVFIRCDQKVPFGAFATVVDALKQANLTNLNVVTEPLETQVSSRQKSRCQVPGVRCQGTVESCYRRHRLTAEPRNGNSTMVSQCKVTSVGLLRLTAWVKHDVHGVRVTIC